MNLLNFALDSTYFDFSQVQKYSAAVGHIEDGSVVLLVCEKTLEAHNIFNLLCSKYGVLLKVEKVSFEQLQNVLTSNAHKSRAQEATIISEQNVDDLIEELPKIAALTDDNEQAPMKRLLNALFIKARQLKASDIHFEPFKDFTSIRMRVLGKLIQVSTLPANLHNAFISQLKILAQLDISERRLPQDGRISLQISEHIIDVRVSTIASTFAERAVLRILDKSQVRLDLDSLKMPEAVFKEFKKKLHHPHGLLLVTGPTGSGKTTTLYSALNSLDHGSLNIMTVEDPVEYELQGVGQIQVNTKIDLTFERALRSILRQDPDVIMIGEIRDQVTAQIAVQAALTGHLVLATIHTNDSISAAARLIDMGVEPFLLSASLLGVLAQRLVRTKCKECSGQGCGQCQTTGFVARQGVYEFLNITPEISNLIHNNEAGSNIFKVAQKDGFRTMFENGKILVEQGITTLSELEVACFNSSLE